jgi:hypothetical protein
VAPPVAMTEEVIVLGSMFLVPNALVDWYYTTYTNMVQRFCDLGVADDDQVIVSHIFIENRKKFSLHVTDKWFKTLERYSVFNEHVSTCSVSMSR